MAGQTIDYDALAQKHGSVASEPDYEALAKRHGAVQSSPPPLPGELSPSEMIRGTESGQGLVPYLGQVASGVGNLAMGTAKMAGQSLEAMGNPAKAMQLGADLAAPQIEQAQQASDAWKQGHHSEAFGHGLASALPIVGPAAADIGEKLGGGDYTGAAADATVLGGAMAAPHVAPPLARAARQGFFGVDPDVALHQAAPWRVSGPDFMERAPVVRGDIKLAAGDTPIVDIPSAKEAVGKFKAVNRAVLDQHLDPYRRNNIQIALDPIADEMEKAIPVKLQLEARTDPAAAQQLQSMRDYINAYRGQAVDIDTFRRMSEETNGELNGFFHRTADAQNAALAQRGGAAMLEAQARGQRAIFRDRFGVDAADIQRRWGYADDFDAALDAGYRKMLNEKAVSPSVTAQRVAGIPGHLFHGDVESGINSLRGKTNSLIKRAFEQTEPGWQLPMPQQGFGGIPQALPPNRQLPAATPQLPLPGANASYVSTSGLAPGAQQNVWQGINAPRQLPAGQAPFTQGTSAVNPSAMRAPGVAGRMLEAPSPGPQIPTSGRTHYMGPAGASEAGPVTSSGSLTAPRPPSFGQSGYAPPDTSGGRVVQGQFHPPYEAEPSVIPPSATQRVIDLNTRPTPGGSRAGADWWSQQPLTRPELQSRYEQLFNRAENLSPQRPVRVPETGLPEGVARGQDARENIARQVLKGRSLAEASPTERNVIDQLIHEGYGSAPPRVTAESIATQIGKQIWSALGGSPP